MHVPLLLFENLCNHIILHVFRGQSHCHTYLVVEYNKKLASGDEVRVDSPWFPGDMACTGVCNASMPAAAWRGVCVW